MISVSTSLFLRTHPPPPKKFLKWPFKKRKPSTITTLNMLYFAIYFFSNLLCEITIFPLNAAEN